MSAKRLLLVFFLFVSAGSAFAQTPSFIRTDIKTGKPHLSNIVVGDFNGDRKPDLAVTSHSSAVPQAIYLLLGNGDGTFSPPTLISSGCCSGLAAADFNGDGTLDLVFAGLGATSVLLGNGDGSFQPEKRSPSVASGLSPLVLDLNRDGILDLTFAAQGGGITILLGNGDGTFTTGGTFPITGGNVAAALAGADFNGDGIPDLAASNFWPNAPPFGTAVSVLKGNGDGTFGAPVDFAAGPYPFSLVAADFNRDGKPDLAVDNYQSTTVSVLLGLGDGTFLPHTDLPTSPFPQFLFAADLNADGKLDLVLAEEPTGIGFLLGKGDGTFAAEQEVLVPSLGSFIVGDLNSDGKPDLIATNGPSTLSIFLNTTVADTTPPAIKVSANPSQLRPADGRWAPVTLTGSIKDAGVGLTPSGSTFAVSDEYGQIHPHGPITLRTDGTYTVAVLLRASVRPSDKNGREYVITVKAKDKSGNIGSAKTFVRVPLQ